MTSNKGDELISFVSTFRPARAPKGEVTETMEMKGEGLGLFLCRCGGAVSERINLEALDDVAHYWDGVSSVKILDFPCSKKGLEVIKEEVKEKQLRGFVVAGCSPKTHFGHFKKAAMEAGLNPYMFEMANIREQCAYVHSAEDAQKKAENLIRAAVAKCLLHTPAPVSFAPMRSKRILVVGGEMSAIVAASRVADQGFEPIVVTSRKALRSTLPFGATEGVPSDLLKPLISGLQDDPGVSILAQSELTAFDGTPGNFSAMIETPEKSIISECGAVIVALESGESACDTAGSVTHQELEEMMDSAMASEHVVIITSDALGSPPCGRSCDIRALENALELKTRYPDLSVSLVFRDMRAFGMSELDYRKAQEYGVNFIRTEEEVQFGEDAVTVRDLYAGDELRLEADMIVTDSCFLPERSEEISQTLQIPLDAHGFFKESQVKLKPSTTVKKGIFLCGSAASLDTLSELVLDAETAASRAVAFLSDPLYEIGGAVAEIEPEKCSACLTCVRSCPYTAPYIGDTGKAEINIEECQGCGICIAICPSKAIEIHYYTDRQIEAQVRALVGEVRR